MMVESINEELERIYALVNSSDICYVSMEDIREINKDLKNIRRKLQVYLG